MGQVYRASHPRLKVEVAVKLLRVGFDSPKLRARFATERETLARMDHPNIAKVFDAGVDAEDRPFIVMELLRGTTFTKFAESHNVDLRTRLVLFRQVCHAIQHAHQKGILHRDIKPSNVLVVQQDEQFVPKVIDFGVARAIDPDVARHTEQGFIVGTLEYMSPEQTLDTSDGIDTRSDLFSLGVLLYELITGDTPTAAIRKQSLPMRDIVTMIREDDPPRPSGIATVAFPSRRIREELDWITFKALEKDPARRYESAAAFANDIGRLLADEAVHAAPPSRRYRLRKFLRRNRAAAIGSAFVVLSLCAGVIGTTWQLLRAMGAEKQSSERATAAILSQQNATNAEDRAVKDRNRAVAAEADANAFNKFLVDHVLAASRPALTKQGLGRSVTLAEALTVAEAQIDRVFADRPTAEIKARIALGQTWFELRRFPDSEKHYLRAIELLARQTVPDVHLQLMCQSVMVQLMYNTSRLVESRRLAETILPQSSRSCPTTRPRLRSTGESSRPRRPRRIVGITA